MGILMVVEGLDGSGKGTQTVKFLERLKSEGYKVERFDFPQYNENSSWLVSEYLKGAFGKDYKSVDPRFATTCYAIDRLITYRDRIKPLYDDDYIIICDRWTTANLIHQSMKAETKEEVDKIIDWIECLEYEKFGLPRPDITFMLEVPADYSYNVALERNKKDGSIKGDIHEANIDFFRRSYENGIYISKQKDWNIVNCYTDSMRSIDDIHEEIYSKFMEFYNNRKNK